MRMLTRIHAAKCIGIEAVEVTVETDVERGIGIHLVGMADTAVKESLLRVVTAMTALKYKVPGKKIVINLAPADLRKSGSGYDLPIAVGIIAAATDVSMPFVNDYLIMGELGLDGGVRYVPGALLYAEFARAKGLKGVVLPYECASEACEISGIEIYGVHTLTQAVSVLSGDILRDSVRVDVSGGKMSDTRPCELSEIPDFADIVGQQGAKRAMEIAAAGGHNIIMVGSIGSGKSTLAKALAGILPSMTKEEALVTRKIYSVCGKGCVCSGRGNQRPFRAPHYSTSIPALIGGGSGDSILPGEVSLAHNGVLFLDEFAQLPRSVIESLRGPLEDRKVVVSRLRTKVEFPASFMLVAASNPCPCGYYGEGDRCTCSPSRREEYFSKLSGPIMDRMDLQVFVRRVQSLNIMEQGRESSAVIAERVRKARMVQARRFREEGIFTNSEMNLRHLSKYCSLNDRLAEVMKRLMDKMGFSMRAYYRIIKLARTIADLDGVSEISERHLLEAAEYRFLDRCA